MHPENILAVLVVLVVVPLVVLFRTLRRLSIARHNINVRLTGRLEPDQVLLKEYFQSSTGLYIYTRQWIPEKPRAVLFLTHGYGEHCGRYNHVAARLQEQGIAVFALDHQGHGRSEGERGYSERFNHFVDDVLAYIRLVLKGQFHEIPNIHQLPRFILGHSMGGLIAITTAMRLSDLERTESSRLASGLWKGLVVTGPALKPDPAIATPLNLMATRVLTNLLPKLIVDKLDARHVCRLPQVVEFYGTDPLNYTGGMHVRMASELLLAMDIAMKRAPTFAWPFLIGHGTADRLCLPSGSEQFFATSISQDKKLNLYPHQYHELFNEPERDLTIHEVLDWIVARMGPNSNLVKA